MVWEEKSIVRVGVCACMYHNLYHGEHRLYHSSWSVWVHDEQCACARPCVCVRACVRARVFRVVRYMETFVTSCSLKGGQPLI